MARSVIKFNVSDIFLEGQNSQCVRVMLINSPLFGAVANLYNRSEKKIRVGHIELGQDAYGINTFIKKVNIVTSYGYPIATVGSNNAAYDSVFFNVCPSPVNYSNRLSTSKPKYLQNKLGPKSDHDAATSFDYYLHQAERFISEHFRSIIDNLIDRVSGRSNVHAPRCKVGNDLAHFLALCVKGEITQSEIPHEYWMQLDNNFKEYTSHRAKFDEAINQVSEFCSGEKWVYMNNINKGVILGMIDTKPSLDTLKIYRIGDFLPSAKEDNYCTQSTAFKWYPSHEAIPDDLRQQVELSLVMLKAHRNSPEMLPSVGGSWLEMGCHAEICGVDGEAVYVLAK